MVKNLGILSLWLLLLFSGTTVKAQTAVQDSSGKVFSIEDLQDQVLSNHPVVKQAMTLSEQARMQVRQALGYFDPALKAGLGRKEFGNTEYYNNWTSELKVPLWLAGADLKVGYDRFVGTYTNPETRTNNAGLTGVGVSIPLGAGLIIDSRRSTLRQAKVMVRYAEADQVKEIISIWYQAMKDYWSWYYAYRQYILLRDGVTLAQQRYEAVSNQAQLGDKPGVDSVEAAITVQDRLLQLEKLKVELQNTRLVLSTHLWNQGGSPLELPDYAVPQQAVANIGNVDAMQLDSLVRLAQDQHPELIKLRSKSSQLEVQRLYAREMLKPKLNVSGTLLSSRTSLYSNIPEYYDYNFSNYKVGIDFAFPLFLRAERGKLQETKLKLLQVDYDLQQTGREIQNNVLTAYNSLKAYESQLGIQVQSIANQEILVNAELQKFDLGESTLFLINSRETKLIDMRVKREELIASYQKTLAELYYKAGTRQNLLSTQ